MGQRKRPRTIRSKNHAECPFIATTVAPFCEEPHQVSKKRKRGDPDKHKVDFVQKSPFNSNGKFKTCQTLDTLYSVKPYKRWYDMIRYNNFVLNNVKYCINDFVYVVNDKSIERQDAADKNPEQQCELQFSDYWVAKILEIKASDEHHVYARVYWMYFPDDLPANTLDNEELVSGRQPYHGQKELIASNHMDVINVVSVAMRAVVHHWVESDDGRTEDVLHWRQALDCLTLQLSSVNITYKFEGSYSSKVLQVKPGNTEQQRDALLSPTPCKAEYKLRVGQSEHCDLVPTKEIEGNMLITTGFTAQKGPPPATGVTTGLLGNGCYPISAESNSQKTVAKVSSLLAVQRTIGTKVSDVGSTSKRVCLISSTGPSSTETRPTLGKLTSALPTRQSTSFAPAPPLYLPFKTQHQLLVRLQHILELACYSFGKQAMPSTLRRRGWDCAELVELNRWTGELLKRQKDFSDMKGIKKPLDELLCSVASIRHSAVHRRHVSTKGIEQFLEDGEALAMLLGDAEGRSEIAMLRQKIRAMMKEETG